MLLQSLLWFHGGINDTNVSGKLFEELAYNAFLGSGHKDAVWNCGGMQQGYDIVVHGARVSCKCGKFFLRSFRENEKSQYLKISSYRMGTKNTLKEKTDFLEKQHEDVILGLSNEHVNHTELHRYVLHTTERKNLDFQTIEWKEHMTASGKMDFRGYSKNGMYAEIRGAMSNQLWFYVPIEFVKIYFDILLFHDKPNMYLITETKEPVFIG